LAIDPVEAERTASEAGICRAVAVATATPSAEVPVGTAGPTLVPVAAAAPPAWDLAVEVEDSVVVVVVGDGGRWFGL
jgi:hypothetical protein